eukprot:3509993-Prymnesium_polylepis.2
MSSRPVICAKPGQRLFHSPVSRSRDAAVSGGSPIVRSQQMRSCGNQAIRRSSGEQSGNQAIRPSAGKQSGNQTIRPSAGEQSDNQAIRQSDDRQVAADAHQLQHRVRDGRGCDRAP